MSRSPSAQLASAQWVWDNMAEPECDEDGLQPCPECEGECSDGDGGDCLACSGKGYFFGDEPMSLKEYERFIEDMKA